MEIQEEVKTETVSPEVATEIGFTKEQIIQSKKYSDRKDLLNALLEDGKSYSLDEIDNMITIFMKGKVK